MTDKQKNSSESDRGDSSGANENQVVAISEDELAKLPENLQKLVLSNVSVTRISYHRSPHLSKEELFAWATVLPDSPDRLLTMSEKEQEHRHTTESRALDTTLLIAKAKAFFIQPLSMLLPFAATI